MTLDALNKTDKFVGGDLSVIGAAVCLCRGSAVRNQPSEEVHE